jgi:hypothetical protein
MSGAGRLARTVALSVPLLGAGPSATVLENERRTLEDIQAFSSAMAAYQSENQGFFDWVRCLADPSSCLPGYAGPPMLSRELASLAPRHGYRRTFHAGPPATSTGTRSSTSIASFAYTAVPERVGITGNRAFCVDGSGYVRESEFDAKSLVTADGRCTPGRMAEEPPPRSVEEIEARVVADLRKVASGEQAYQSANGGYYDTPQCLGAPVRCIPHYPAEAPTFLDERIADLRERHGYRRHFHPGPPAAAAAPPGMSPSSISSFVYTAVPVSPGRGGRRSFCLDARGWVCPDESGQAPAIKDGQCVRCSSPL